MTKSPRQRALYRQRKKFKKALANKKLRSEFIAMDLSSANGKSFEVEYGDGHLRVRGLNMMPRRKQEKEARMNPLPKQEKRMEPCMCCLDNSFIEPWKECRYAEAIEALELLMELGEDLRAIKNARRVIAIARGTA